MNDERLTTIEQAKQFLAGSEAFTSRGVSIEERYLWIESILVRFTHFRLSRAEKGVIRRYIEKVSGYSRAQVCRLIRQYKQQGRLRKAGCKRRRFPMKYTQKDIALLAKTDELHNYLSGQNLTQEGNRDISALTPYTRETGMGRRECITSMPWTRSPKGRF